MVGVECSNSRYGLRIGRVLCLILAFALLTRTPVIAQSEPVSVEVATPERGYVGDAVPLVVTVQGSREAQQPVWPEIGGAEIAFLRSEDRSSSFTMSINGQTTTRRTITLVMVFEARFHRTGVFEIPPVDVIVGSGPSARRLTTQPQRIRIEEPAEDSDFALEFALESTRVFVGQPVLATITWIVGKPVRNVRMALPFDTSNIRLVPGLESTPSRSAASAAGLRAATRADPRQFETTLNGQPMIARIEERVINGTRRQALSVEVVLIPQRPGSMSVGPVRVDYDAVIGQRPRRFTDAPWDDLSIVERQASIASPVEMAVLALPSDSRPANFTGLVGRYEISSSARPVSASVGEPIELNVTVKGPHPISLVPPLDLAPQMARSEPLLRMPAEPILPSIDGGTAHFAARVRARSDQVRAIPPVGLAYFDPVDETYRTAWTNPIPLSIHGSASIGLPDDDGDSDTATIAGAQTVQRELPRGMADIHRVGLADRASAFDRLVFGSGSPWLAVVFVVPVLVYVAGLVGVGVARLRISDSRTAQLRRARRRALASLRTLDRMSMDTRDAGRVVRTFVGDCAGIEGRAFTAQEAIAALPSGLADETWARAVALIDSTEQAFAADSVPTGGGVTRIELRRMIDRVFRAWARPSETDSPTMRGRAA